MSRPWLDCTPGSEKSSEYSPPNVRWSTCTPASATSHSTRTTTECRAHHSPMRRNAPSGRLLPGPLGEFGNDMPAFKAGFAGAACGGSETGGSAGATAGGEGGSPGRTGEPGRGGPGGALPAEGCAAN
ncbi:hypothetical protein GCM10010211_52560 [Streptomyces albospinus]|uniref:Uncharacterized protein n=1 Tax=Streptomyces albospinus TaxID=285515 RepID=A0ABQ2VCK4_9ACTN|nr:hypothetical protein GCM10010211_52560 [Streptomyces albospinus]